MTKTTIKKLDNSEVEITGEIETAVFEAERAHIMDALRQGVTIDGFRPGHAPDQAILEKVGDEKILFDMAEESISKAYPSIIEEHKIDAIGRPEIIITKIAAGNPLGFKLKTAVMPIVTLPDYKKIAVKNNSAKDEEIKVEDKEIDEVLGQLQKMRAPGSTSSPQANTSPDTEPVEVPPMDDEFAKSLGRFESLSDLRAKVGENIKMEKEARAKDKKRATLIEEIAKDLKAELPEILVDGETQKMLAEMQHETEQMGMKFEDYLTHLKKTVEDLRKDWKPLAEKRVKTGLALHQIAETEKITPTDEEIEHELGHMMEHYKDLDKNRARAYIENTLTNEKVFKFLEDLK